MKRAEIIRHLKDFIKTTGIPVEAIQVDCGAAMVLHRARKEAQDIDISLPPDIWMTMLVNFPELDVVSYPPIHAGDPRIRVLKIPYGIDVHIRLIDSVTTTLCGFQVQALAEILKWKKWAGREKDQADIDVLEKLFVPKQGYEHALYLPSSSGYPTAISPKWEPMLRALLDPNGKRDIMKRPFWGFFEKTMVLSDVNPNATWISTPLAFYPPYRDMPWAVVARTMLGRRLNVDLSNLIVEFNQNMVAVKAYYDSSVTPRPSKRIRVTLRTQ